MKKEYLQAYQAKEREDFDRFYVKFSPMDWIRMTAIPLYKDLKLFITLLYILFVALTGLIMKRFGLKFHLQELY